MAAAAQLPVNLPAGLGLCGSGEQEALQRSRVVMLARKEESCLAGTAVAAVLAKIAWSCADVEQNLSSGRELPMRESQQPNMPRARARRKASMPPEWRGAWADGGAQRSTIFGFWS